MNQFSTPISDARSKRRGASPIAHTAITIEDTFWAPRQKTLRERTLPHIYRQLEEHEYFRGYKTEWTAENGRIPYLFWESDISKWIEAASYSLATHPDAALEAQIDRAIAFLGSLQQPDGYLNLWFTAVEPEKRWTNLRDWHELYCAGHLIEGAVAHAQATGKHTLLDIVKRYVDHIDTQFGPEEGKRRGYCGHEEIELALVKLFRLTGEERYLRLAHYFIEERGRQPHYFDQEARTRGEDPADFWAHTYEYNQSHLPVREQHEVVGHAVRAMYLYCALADLAQELDDVSLQQSDEHFWHHLISRRMYITGGIGPSAHNEGFTTDYDLPNRTAYAETCAAIGLVFWAHRMLQLDTDRRYADVLERALYNGILSAISLDGETFFYENPLESQGHHHRKPWFRCACCPPNIARLLASLGQYVYSLNENEVIVHLYMQSTSTLSINGQAITLKQETNYPWDGTIVLSVATEQPVEFGLTLRIPGWCQKASLAVNGEPLALELQKGYAQIKRVWQKGDQVTLTLDMPVELVRAHPDIREDQGSIALQRGPLVYCLEGVDNAFPLHRIRIPVGGQLTSHYNDALLGGVAVIQGDVSVVEVEDWADDLYRPTPPAGHSATLTAIPYYAWDNRQAGEMAVWLHTKEG